MAVGERGRTSANRAAGHDDDENSGGGNSDGHTDAIAYIYPHAAAHAYPHAVAHGHTYATAHATAHGDGVANAATAAADRFCQRSAAGANL